MMNNIDKNVRIPVYLQCATVIRKAIEDGRYGVGAFLPSERELSREFNINRLTLRKGLAELVRQGLLENIPGAGNRVVTQTPQRVQRYTIACMMLRQGKAPTLSPFYADIIEGIEGVISSAGYDLVVTTLDPSDLWGEDDRPRAAPRNAKMHFDGVILIDGITDELILTYHKKGIPLVLVDRPSSIKGVPGVTVDNRKGAYDAARYMIDQGHRHIAYAGAASDPISDERFSGFKQALDEANITFLKRDFMESGYLIDSSYAVVSRYVSKNRDKLPTAICAINDEAAMGAMKALQERDIPVPEEISVIGFDDIAWSAHTQPPLSSVRMPRKQMGEIAAQMLLQQLTQPTAGVSQVVLQTELIIRDSCRSC